jgi:Flp pilus assembly protein CpaB
MTFDPLFAIIVAAGVVAAGLFAIHRWGPGRSRRWVHCPEKETDAQVLVERKEGSFGALLPPDVVSCSLLPGGPVDCDKACLRR